MKACRRRRQKEADRVLAITLEWSIDWEHCSFGEHWGFPGYRIKIKGDHHHLFRKQGKITAL